MISVDTNLLARLLLKDDAEQFKRALAILASHEQVFIPITVILELGWLLRGRGSSHAEVVASLRAILCMPQVSAQHHESLHRALNWANDGIGIADAIHVSLSERALAFVTFDKSLARQASRLAINPGVRIA